MSALKPIPARIFSKRRLRSFSRRHPRLLLTAPLALAGALTLIAALVPHQTRTAQATAAPRAAPTPAAPVRLAIPKLHLTAGLDKVGLAPDRTMASPTSADNPAWYDLGPRPGAKGNAVIAGHLDGQNFAPAVFYHLHELTPGDEIIVTDDHAHSWRFRVDHSQAYDARHAPMTQIFGAAPAAHLNLITCAGSWDRSRQQYNDRLVVFADAVH